MKYIKAEWQHEESESMDPIIIYSEIQDDGWEKRKVELYADGKFGFADKDASVNGTPLSLEPMPTVEEIDKQEKFAAIEISPAEFEEVWTKASKDQ